MLLEKGILEIYKDFESEIVDIYNLRLSEGFTNSIDLQTDYLDFSDFYIDILKSDYELNLRLYF